MKHFLACLFIICSEAVSAQLIPSFKRYTIDDGLPSSEVYRSFQDSKGYIWFATDLGVSRFNGYEFQNYDTENGLTDNTVLNISEDSKGRIWFLPISGKLCYLYKNRIYAYKYNHVITHFLEVGSIFISMHVDQNDNVYLTGNRSSLVISAGGQIKADKLLAFPTAYIPEGNVWLHLKSFPPVSAPKIRYHELILDINKTRQTEKIKTTDAFGSSTFRATRDNEYVYALVSNVLCKFSLEGKKIQKFHSERAMLYIYRDNEKGLWAPSSQGGVYYFPDADLDKPPTILFKDLSITAVFQDRNGSFWLTSEKGVLFISSLTCWTLNASAGLSNDYITCLAVAGDTLFAGNYKGTIDIITGSKITSLDTRKIDNTPTNMLYDLHYNAGILWFSGRGTGGIIDSRLRMTPIEELKFCRKIISHNGLVWSGNYGNLFQMSPAGVITSKAAPKRINAIGATGDMILLGTIDGLWVYNITAKEYVPLIKKSPLLNSSITDIACQKNNVFLATKGFGLIITDSDFKNIKQISTRDGLSSNNIKQVFADSGCIWLATDKGLNQVTYTGNMAQPYKIEIRNTDNGLISNTVNDIVKHGDMLWLATDKGITMLNSREKRKRTFLPLYIQEVKVNGEIIEKSKLGDLSYQQNNITISYEGVAVKGSSNVRYRYKLNGVDPQWNYTASREVQFANLAPGRYEFFVGIEDIHRDNPEIKRLLFIIAPPFWNTWWFLLLLGIMLPFIGAVSFKIRAQGKNKREKEKEELNRKILELEHKALRAQMNPHFVFNCMNSIQRFILGSNAEEAYTYMVKFSRLMRNVLDNSQKETIRLSDELATLKLYLELEKLRFKTKFSYQVVVAENIDTNTEIPAMLIQPYIENAIWHGLMQKNGDAMLTLMISSKDQNLEIVIEDNGIGRIAAQQKKSAENPTHKSYGMTITQDRINAINAKYNLRLSVKIIDLEEAGHPLGTRVEITLPSDIMEYI